MYTCPVCSYDRLEVPPENWSICPCCLTEFGYSDSGISHAKLRKQWLAAGAHWEGPFDIKPENWRDNG